MLNMSMRGTTVMGLGRVANGRGCLPAAERLATCADFSPCGEIRSRMTMTSMRVSCCSSLESARADLVEFRTRSPPGNPPIPELPRRRSRRYLHLSLQQAGAFAPRSLRPASLVPVGGSGVRLQRLRAYVLSDSEGPPSSQTSSSSLDISEKSTCVSLQSSIMNAFISMVLMLKALHSYALQLRSQLFYEDVETVAHVIHMEMQASFLWLFQQVFSCTPLLMVSVMLLFSNFTAFSAASMVSEIHLLPATIHNGLSPSPLAGVVVELEVSGSLEVPVDTQESVYAEPELSGEAGGRGGWRVPPVTYGDGRTTAGLFRSKDPTGRGLLTNWSEPFSLDDGAEHHRAVDISSDLSKLLEGAVREMELSHERPLAHLQLDQEVVRCLVAPVSIALETDDYSCFDRTELQYQEAIQEDEHNPMLLSNYAHFLYIVRRDFDRAEACFHRALREDPTDGDILGRFATFLWLARKDKEAAERAYKAALASSPDNPYYSGSYAHFLWHSGEDEVTCPLM